MVEHSIHEEDGDIRLDRWFKRHYPALTHGILEKHLRKGDIRLEGKKVKSSDRVTTGQTITIKVVLPVAESVPKEEKKSARVNPEDILMLQEAVLYKDNDVIVINKPPGLAVQGGSGINKSVDSLLDCLTFEKSDRPKLVHRLDKDTSGVLVLARSAKVATRLMRLFAGKEPEKIYWALIKGVPQMRKGKIDFPLAKQEEGDIEKMGIDEEAGKKAVTFYRVIDALSDKVAWVELMPQTGRTHQLRVHMREIGHPIVGDGKYGGRDAFVDGMEISRKLHLHAHRLIIPGMLDVTAPLPKHMENSWKVLGLEG